MGPASIAADLLRPPQPDARAADAARAAPDGHRFDDYLSEVRGADDANQPDDVDEASPGNKSDEKERTDDASRDSDVDSQPTNPAPAVAPSTPAPSASIQTALNLRGKTDAAESSAEVARNETDAPKSPTHAASPDQNPSQSSDESGIAPRVDVTVAARESGQSSTTGRDQSGPAPAKPDIVPPHRQDVAGDSNQRAPDGATQTNETSANLSTDRTEDKGVIEPRAPQRPASTTDESTDRSVADKPPVVSRETVFERKVRESIDARRVEPANEAANRPAPRRASNERGNESDAGARDGNGGSRRGAATAQTSVHRANTLGVSSPAAATEAASIKSGTGDSVAVAALRLLVSNPGPDANPGGSASTGNASGHGTFAQTIGALDASVSTGNGLLNDLIAGASDRSAGVEGIARSLQASGVPGRYQATLRLDPPSMGQVRVQMLMRHEGLAIQVEAQSRSAAKLIESRMDDLREALSSHGIRVERAEVVTKSPASADTGDRGHDASNEQPPSFAGGADRDPSQEARRWHDAPGRGYPNFESNDARVGDGIGVAPGAVESWEDQGAFAGISGARIALNVFA